MATFVLVHGAHLGSWSWNLVITSLNRRGHQAINIDLPTEENGAKEYSLTIGQQIDASGVKDDIVVVGHALAGLVIPLLADKYPVRKFIYLAPLILSPGYSVIERLHDKESNMLLVDQFPNPVSDRSSAFKYWLHDCEPDIAYWAASRFRPQHFENLLHEKTPVNKFPQVEAEVIVCTNDRLINPQSAQDLSKNVLKVEPITIDSGHCPQLSRPQELALLLMQLGNARKK